MLKNWLHRCNFVILPYHSVLQGIDEFGDWRIPMGLLLNCVVTLAVFAHSPSFFPDRGAISSYSSNAFVSKPSNIIYTILYEMSILSSLNGCSISKCSYPNETIESHFYHIPYFYNAFYVRSKTSCFHKVLKNWL